MERRTLIKKLIKYTLLLILLSVVAFFSYIRYGGYLLTDKESRNNIISEIKAAPQLPDNFMTVYNDLYPKAMENSGWKYTFGHVISNVYTECPSRDHAVRIGSNRMRGAFYYIAQINFVLEDNVSQQQCLNRVLQTTDFTHHVIGTENAAQAYFNKPLNQLNEDEVLEILVRLTNPSLYNKERMSRYQIFMGRCNTLKSKLEKNRRLKQEI